MNITTDSIEHHQPRRGLSFPEGQLAFLFLLLGIGGAVILATVQRATFSTALLFVFVAVYGLMRCRITQTNLGDPKLKILGYFWLIKLGLTLFLLYVGWIPQLDPASSSSWGYDPQRYYIYAQELIENNWRPEIINYVGILYYYAAILYIFGNNPVTPALINAFVTLIASLYLIKVGYLIKIQRDRRDWTIAWVLLLPEILWFDVMTSRETILGALIIFALLTMGIYFLRNTAISLIRVLIVVGLSLLAITVIRTSMMIPVFAAIVLMMFTIKQQGGTNITKKIIPLFLILFFLLAGLILNIFLGGFEFDILNSLQMATSASQNITTELYSGSQNSIGMLLFPEGIIQSILFLPPRMLLYLVAPLPNISISLINMWEGSWSDWQKLFTILSSVINILVMPYVLASLIQSFKNRQKNSAPLIFTISYWVTFVAISGGNLIIHERYRVMATILFFGCAWLGARTCSRKLISKTSLGWYGLLSFSAIFYISYKFLF